MLWAVIFAVMAYPEPKEEVNKTIIQIEIDLEKIDGSLKNIEQTIQEIFGKLEIEINTGE
jgi:predicted  nucleic acid-binding Zn-ribbon protein